MIEISNLTKKYGEHKIALDNISFNIKPGEICGYIGTNGAGKTTTIKILTGSLDFDSGIVKVSGFDVKSNPLKVKEITGYVPESGSAFNSLSAFEYLDFISKIRNLKVKEINERIDYFAELFGYSEYLNSSIGNLSKGTKQKILITSAFIHNPDVILLDEPINGLDANTIFIFQDMIKTLSVKGKTVFYCSHILDMIEKISTKLIILDNGKIKLDSETGELKKSGSYSGLEDLFKNMKSEKEYRKFVYEDIFS